MWRLADSQIVTDVSEDLAASVFEICFIDLRLESFHAVTQRLEKIHFNIILPPTFRFENWSLPFTVSAQNCACIFNFAPCHLLHILLGPLLSRGKNALSKNTELWLRVERWLVNMLTFPDEIYIQTWAVEILRGVRKSVKNPLPSS
jgi:hypothetical protein